MAENRRRPYLTTKKREPTILPNHSECLYEIEPEKMQKCIDFCLAHLKIDNEMSTAEAGIYTWIIKETEDGYVFVAGRTLTSQEICTLHTNLDSLSTKKGIVGSVVAAGEMQIDDMSVEYNFHSGTYMERAFKRGPAAIEKIKEVTFDKMIELFTPGRIISEVDRQILYRFAAKPNNIAHINRFAIRRPFTAKGGFRKHLPRKTVRRSGRFRRRV